MFLKKIISLLLMATLCVGLVGCGGKSNLRLSKEEMQRQFREGVILHYESGNAYSSKAFDAAEEYVDIVKDNEGQANDLAKKKIDVALGRMDMAINVYGYIEPPKYLPKEDADKVISGKNWMIKQAEEDKAIIQAAKDKIDPEYEGYRVDSQRAFEDLRYKVLMDMRNGKYNPSNSVITTNFEIIYNKYE